MGRNTRGVKGITLRGDDHLVGMVVAHPELDLLTVCANGFGKRTPFGPPGDEGAEAEPNGEAGSDVEPTETAPAPQTPSADAAGEAAGEEAAEESTSSSMSYRRQRRGGMGLRNIKTTERNGKVVDTIAVSEADEILMVTAQGKIQRVRVREISQIGRNTQGVRIIRLDEGDTLVSVARVPNEDEA
jgi:DNA gyrase subunit A